MAAPEQALEYCAVDAGREFLGQMHRRQHAILGAKHQGRHLDVSHLRSVGAFECLHDLSQAAARCATASSAATTSADEAVQPKKCCTLNSVASWIDCGPACRVASPAIRAKNSR